jgi:small subunit ribosomal protein S24e
MRWHAGVQAAAAAAAVYGVDLTDLGWAVDCDIRACMHSLSTFLLSSIADRASVPKAELKEKIAQFYKVKDENTVLLWNFRTNFGGGKSTGYCCIYDSVEDAKKLHAKHLLVRAGLVDKAEKKGRKGLKESKNRSKKVRGLGRRTARKKAKRAE